MEDGDVLHVDTGVASQKCPLTREKGAMATGSGALGWDSLRDSSGQLQTGQEVTSSPGPLSPLPCGLILSLRSAGSSI